MGAKENEIVVYNNPAQAFCIWRKSRFQFTNASRMWHYHHEMEIVIPVNGELSINLSNNEKMDLHTGQVAVIGPYEPHFLSQYQPEIQYMVFQVDVFKYLGHELMNLKYFAEAGRLFTRINYVLRQSPEVNGEIYFYIHEIYNEFQQKQKGYEIAIHSLIHRVILTLLRNDTKGVLNMDYSPEFQRLLPVLEYIEQYITERISMQKSCALVNMSYYHFSKFFKRVMGKSFREYVNYKKMQHAERLLLTTEQTILEIATSLSMPNLANFYHVFASQYHCTPYEFRRKTRLDDALRSYNKKP